MAISTVGSNGLTNPLTGITSSTVTSTGDASISGLTVGKGGGASVLNTAVGNLALASNSSGTQNSAFGNGALNTNSSGGNNTAIGYYAQVFNTTGGNNTSVGNQALYSNTTASYNTAVGYQALYSESTSSNNTAVGYQAGYSHNGSAGAYANTYIGYQAGYAATSGYVNTFVGYNAGSAVTTGLLNTIVGAYTGNSGGLDIRTSSGNIVLADGSGNPRYYFDAASGDWFLNQITAGYYCLMRYKNQAGSYFSVGTQAGASPNFQIYNPSGGGVYLGYSASSWTGVSDAKLKNITGEISNGLSKVQQLRAAEFTWKHDDTNEPQVGLIAQDVQKVLPEAVSENEGNLGVRYTEVIPLLVAAIKELKAEFDAYKASHP
jgi:hypothetical protein